MRGIALTRKSSAATVSSWGFSGYIAVLPKESKPTSDKPKKKEKEPDKTSAERNCR